MSNQGERSKYFKKGNTLYHQQPRFQGSNQRNDQRGGNEIQKREQQGRDSCQEKSIPDIPPWHLLLWM